VTAAQWPRRGGPKAAKRPDLEALTGLRSGKPHYYPEYRISAERLRRVILALERISGALVRTMEGSEALVRAVVDAAAEHLSAEWVVFALVEGELPDVRPRHLVRGPSDDTPEHVRRHVDQVSGGHPDGDHDAQQARHHLHVPIRLDSRAVGGFAAWTPAEREIEDTDHSVLRILAGQTAAALQNAALLDHSARLHARTARQAADLKARNTELLAAQAELGAARQRAVLDDERHRIARELHDSVTQYAPVRGHAHRAGAFGDRRRPAAHPARHGQGPHPARGRAAPVGDLRAPRRARRGRGPPVHAAQAVRGAHARRAVGGGAHRREAGGAARRVRAVAVPHRG
jgi:hypothetical protein